MITAKEAFKRSALKNSYNELLTQVDREIRNATERGDFHCAFCIAYNTGDDPDYPRLKIVDELMRNGYHVETKFNGDPERNPSVCYYVLTITWDKTSRSKGE